MRRRRFTATAIAALFGTCMVVPALAADIDYGKPGTPVKLVVGYQPYYTQAWSGVVMRGKKFYEKYLPKGSEVEFQIGLQGAIIVNNLLAGKQNIGYMGDMPAIVSTTKQDVAVMWEPTTSRLVEEGLARLVATGASVQENDGGFLGMRADLIKQRPDVVKAWLEAELDAQLFLADPKNAAEVIKMAKEQTTGFSDKVLWNSLYGRYPASAGGTDTRNVMYYTFTPETRELIKRAASFLYSIKSINVETLRPEAIESKWTEDILKERGLKAPIGEVKALPDSQAPKG